MTNIQVNHALDAAIADAKQCAEAYGLRYAVVIGYDDYDRLCWSPVPVNELCTNDEPVFITDAVAANESTPSQLQEAGKKSEAA